MAKGLPRGVDRQRSGRYRARMFYMGEIHSLGTFATVSEARMALDIAKGEKAKGTFIPPRERKAEALAEAESRREARGVSVDDVAAAYFAWMEKAGRTRGTIYTYSSRYAQHIGPALGSRPIVDVSPDDVDHWYAALHAARGEGVAHSAYITLSSLFTWAAGHARGQSRTFRPYITESPAQVEGATRHKPVRATAATLDRVASPAELAAVVEGMPRKDSRLAVLLAGWLALRIGEVLGLQRRDVSSTARPDGTLQWWLRVDRQLQARGAGLYLAPPKSEAGRRTLPVPDALAPMLVEQLEKYTGPGREAPLFPRTPGAPDTMHPNTLRTRFTQARNAYDLHAKEAGLPTLGALRFHDLRHTALTRLGQAGATLEELKRYAGHASADVVARYQHAEASRLAALAEKLSGAVVTDSRPVKPQTEKATTMAAKKKARMKTRKKATERSADD